MSAVTHDPMDEGHPSRVIRAAFAAFADCLESALTEYERGCGYRWDDVAGLVPLDGDPDVAG